MIKYPLNVIHLDFVDSTNTYAKSLLRSGEALFPYTVIVADEQTEGCGRLSRVWHSKKGESLCMSLIVPYPHKPAITLLSALAVHKVLGSICSGKLRIKWPNDIIAENKKLCGILTEGTEHAAVIGIGVNLNNTDFPQEISCKATSLRLLTGNTFESTSLAERIAASVFEVIEASGGNLDRTSKEEYESLCANIGKEIFFGENTARRGVAVGIDDDGSLLAETENGLVKIGSGEVTVSGIY